MLCYNYGKVNGFMMKMQWVQMHVQSVVEILYMKQIGIVQVPVFNIGFKS